MAFRDRATLLSTLPIAAGDTPGGYPAGTRFVDNGEPAEGEVVNRGMAALAENTDDLDTRMTRDLAVPIVGAFSFAGPDDEIVIDMTGGASGDINYTGSLFMGSSGWPDNKVNRDNLFQFLDDDYNEVLVDGEEVYVGGTITGAAIGDGFHTTPAVTLKLRTASQNPVIVPAGSYRLGHFEGSNVGTLDEAVFVGTTIRGLQENPAEAGFKSVYVVAPDTAYGPADYIGASALEDALTMVNIIGGKCKLYVRAGNYTFSSSFTLTASDVEIIGTSDASFGGVHINMTGGAYDFVVSGINVEITHARFLINGGQKLEWDDPNGTMRYVTVFGGEVHLDAAAGGFVGEFIEIYCVGSSSRGLVLNGVKNVSFTNMEVACSDYVALHVVADVQDLKFTNCQFESADAICFHIEAAMIGLVMDNCLFESDQQVVECYQLSGYQTSGSLTNCRFENTATPPSPPPTAWYATRFFRWYSANSRTDETHPAGLSFVNCKWTDTWCQGHDGGAPPATGAFNAFPVLEIFGAVTIENMKFDRSGQQTYMVEDSELIKLTGCLVNGLTLHLYPAPPHDATGTPSFGLIHLDDSIVKDIHIDGDFTGDWDRGLLYLNGDNPSSSAQRAARCVVDGLDFMSSSGGLNWSMAETTIGFGAIATLTNNCTLRRARISNTDFNSALTTNQLISMLGSYNVVERCHIYFPDPTEIRCRYAITFGAHGIGKDARHNKVLDNFIYMEPNVNHQATIYGRGNNDMRTNQLLGQSYGEIKGNTIVWYGTGADSSPSPGHFPIQLITNCFLFDISHNSIEVDDCSGTATVIDVTESFLTGAVGEGAGTTFHGNKLVARRGTTQPTISVPAGVPFNLSENFRLYFS